jgi:hypothetical protein
MDELLRLLMSNPLSPPGLDPLRVQTFICAELHRIHGLLLRGTQPAAGSPGAASGSNAAAPPHADEVTALLHRARRLLLQHPTAAQAAFSALVAEGRKFAATPEGRRQAVALASSPLIRHATELWGALGLDMLEEDPDTVVPSAWLEALVRGAQFPNLAAVDEHSKSHGGTGDGEPR